MKLNSSIYFFVKIPLFTFIIFFSSLNIAFGQCNSWIEFGSPSQNNLGVFPEGSMDVDSSGFVYTAYKSRNSTSFFYGDTLTNTLLPFSQMLVVSKVDSTGNAVWNRKIEVSQYYSPIDIHTHNRSLYLSTTISGSFAINNNYISKSEPSILVVKFDLNGNVIWFRNITVYANGSINLQNASGGITTDHSGNILLTGTFSGRMELMYDTLRTNITSIGPLSELFVMKLDSLGNDIWAIQSNSQVGQANYVQSGYDIEVDYNNNIVIAGSYRNNMSLDGFTISDTLNTYKYAPFVAKLKNSDASVKWLKYGEHTGSNNNFQFSNFYDLEIDNANNIYLAAILDSAVNFEGTPLNTTGKNNIGLLKLDTSGNTVFVKEYGGNTNLSGASVHLNIGSDNYLYMAGFSNGEVKIGNDTLCPNNNLNAGLIAKFDLNGNPLDVYQITHSSNFINKIKRDKFDKIYFSGVYQGDTIHNIDSSVFIPSINRGMYLGKACISNLTSTHVNKISNEFSNDFSVYPNPSFDQFSILIDNPHKENLNINLFDNSGRLVKSESLKPINGKRNLSLKNLDSGIYYLQVVFEKNVMTRRIIKL